MRGTDPPFPRRERALQERLRFCVTPQSLENETKPVNVRDNVAVIRSIGGLTDSESPAGQRFGLGIAALPAIERGQVEKAVPERRVGRSEALLADVHRAKIERLGVTEITMET